MTQTLHIYLHDSWRAAAEAGKANIFNRMAQALPRWVLRFHPDTEEERLKAAGRGYGLFHMQEPTAPTILSLRRAYEYPFWRIEKTNERWNFDVALAAFDPDEFPVDEAIAFRDRWRKKLFPDVLPRSDGFIFMPLQGHLSRHRSFQSKSPFEMIEATLEADPRPVLATLHPKETYTKADLDRLAGIERRFSRFRLSQQPSTNLLKACDLVVTQNSSLALRGYILDKPAVLFADIDFHHIAGSVLKDGVAAAFGVANGPRQDFAAYLRWFWGKHAISAGAPDAETRIRDRLASHGWPVG